MSCHLARRAAAALIACLAAEVAEAQTRPGRLPSLLGEVNWSCTQAPRGLWLPLSVLNERLQSEGVTVLESTTTYDNCYELKLVGQDQEIRVKVFDPVSGKPLR